MCALEPRFHVEIEYPVIHLFLFLLFNTFVV